MKKFLSLLLMICSISLAKAQDFDESGAIHLGRQAVIAEDPNNEWTLENIREGKYDSLFTPTESPIPNINFTNSAYWMIASFKNKTNGNQFFLECARPITNEVVLYVENQEGEIIQISKGGDDLTYDQREFKHRRNVFLLNIQPKEKVRFYLKMLSDGEVINAQMKIWKIDAFSNFSQQENLFLGGYYGILLTVFVIFSFIASVMRQRIYYLYVAYIASLMLMQASLDGTAFQLFWPFSTWMANHSVLLFSSTSVWLMMLYAADYLKLSSMPKAYRFIYYVLNVLIALCAISSLTSGITYELTFPVVNGISLVVLIFIIGGIIWKSYNKQQVNFLFALGFISVLNGGILFISGNIGLYFNEFFTDNALKIGSTFEVIFLSMAMAGQYRNIQKEKEAAQKEAYTHLEAINKITENQKERLERIVVKRTREIRSINEQLEEKNHEIIDSINYAKRIQEAILPPNEYFFNKLPNAFISYMPKDIVAGDFYWMEHIKNPEDTTEEVILFAAADCTGHGVPGAMVSVVCSNALNRAVREYGLFHPNEILDKTAELVEETFSKSIKAVKDGMDISLCAYYPKQSKLEWSGANNPLYIVSKHDSEFDYDRMMIGDDALANLYELKADKQPIGQFENRQPYTLHCIPLKKGDTVYSFSDGFADQFGGEKGKKYKTKNMKEFLRKIYMHPINEHDVLLKWEFTDWRGELEQIDDVCIVGFRV